MPPRLNKRQQRELEELEALSAAKPEAQVNNPSEDELAPGPSGTKSGGGFSAVRHKYSSEGVTLITITPVSRCGR